MKQTIGKALQLFALISLPSSMWVTQFEHNEALAIGILGVSIVIFYLGVLLRKK